MLKRGILLVSLICITVLTRSVNSAQLSYANQLDVLQTITSLNSANITLLSTHEGGRFVFFEPNGSKLISATQNDILEWNLISSTYNIVQGNKFHIPLTDHERIETVAFSPLANRVAFASIDGMTSEGRTRVLDIDTGVLTTLVEENLQVSVGMYEPIHDLEFDPSENVLARTIFSSVQLWNVDSHQVINSLGGERENPQAIGEIMSVAFSPNGRYIAAATGNNSLYNLQDQSIHIWNAETLEPLQILEGHTSSVLRVVFSPDSSLLASQSIDETIRLWRMDTFETVAIMDTDYWEFNADLVFSPDGSLLASSALWGAIDLWNVQTGERVVSIQNPESDKRIGSLAFSPDGALLASANLDNLIQLWGIPSSTDS